MSGSRSIGEQANAAIHPRAAVASSGGAHVKTEVAKWRKLIQEAGIRAE